MRKDCFQINIWIRRHDDETTLSKQEEGRESRENCLLLFLTRVKLADSLLSCFQEGWSCHVFIWLNRFSKETFFPFSSSVWDLYLINNVIERMKRNEAPHNDSIKDDEKEQKRSNTIPLTCKALVKEHDGKGYSLKDIPTPM